MIEWTVGLSRVTARMLGCRYIILFTNSAKGFYEKKGFSVSEIKRKEESFYFMYRDLFPECIKLDQK